MNPLEKLCLDAADELALVSEVFIRQFDGNENIKLLNAMEILVVQYKTNRNLLESIMPKKEK